MKTFIYNSAALSVNDRLTISSLLGLFQSRLSAKWVSSAHAQEQPAALVMIDVDLPDGPKHWEASNSPAVQIAVTEANPSRHHPYVSRPIRAFGPNGVIVLFNNIAQSLSAPIQEPVANVLREPSRMRMTGRLEAAAPPARPTAPQIPLSRPTVPRAVAPPPLPLTPKKEVEEAPVRVRVAIRWGAPEPVYLPPLQQMPGARIHGSWLTPAASPPTPPAAVVEPADEPAPAPPVVKFFSAPEASPLPPLVQMPVAHRPIEVKGEVQGLRTPIFNRVKMDPPRVVEAPEDVPTLRSAPRQWRAPEPEPVSKLFNFEAPQELPVPAAPVEEASPVADVPAEPVADVITTEEVNVPPEIAPTAAVPSPEPEPQTEDEEVKALYAHVEQQLEKFSQALVDEEYLEAVQESDAEVDWWGTPTLEAGEPDETIPSGSLFDILRAAKASAQPGILEIAGLPAICVIPARNVYFTTAPAARIESAITTRTEISWRACASENEARQLSGTEQSRQASLEQLSWTASLLAPSSDPGGIADRSVRLRRWPPITESRGRSKYLRYATMLSGAQATPRELADITGDPIEEIVSFVNACSRMNLLETSGQTKGAYVQTSAGAAGVGILRGMIEQLTPPKL